MTHDDFCNLLSDVLTDIEELLVSKNRKYGNSALEPQRVFSKASPLEQLDVRIDDKISRLKSGQLDDDEDTVTDLIGYLLLREVAKRAADGPVCAGRAVSDLNERMREEAEVPAPAFFDPPPISPLAERIIAAAEGKAPSPSGYVKIPIRRAESRHPGAGFPRVGW